MVVRGQFRSAGVLLVVVLFSPLLHAFDFDWTSIGWSNGTTTPQTFTNVDGSGIDITIETTGDTGQMTNTTPGVYFTDGDNELVLFPDFGNPLQSITVVMTFSQPVLVSGLTVKDIDATTFADGIRVEGFQVSGASVAPNTVLAGSNVATLSSTEWEPIALGGWGYSDPEAQLTTNFNNTALVERVEISQFPGSLSPVNPTGQAISISDFEFLPSDLAGQCDTNIPFSVAIDDDADDGWWDRTNVRFDRNDYKLGQSASPVDRAAGVRFNAVDIPANATVSGVTLSFLAHRNDSGGTSRVDIQAVDSANAPAFGALPPTNLTSTTVDWTLSDWSQNNRYTVDVTTVLQDLVDTYDGLSNAAVAFVLTATGDDRRRARDYGNNGQADAAILSGTYSCASDSSDAPSGYSQATHDIPTSPTIYIGSVAPDSDATDLASPDATGDDVDNTDDEEGVSFTATSGPNPSIIASVVVSNTSGANVNICGWLDRPDGTTGSFTAADVAIENCQSTAGGTVQFTWPNMPEDQSYTTFARFRVTSDPLASTDWAGAASDGEVEDYEVRFDFRPTAVSIGKVDLAALPVAEFLAGLAVASLDRSALENLNLNWQPARADTLQGASRATQLAALENYLDPDSDGQVAVLSWDTLEERGTIGFYVERRTGSGSWQRVNQRLLPGLITAPMGGDYRLVDPTATAGVNYEYRLVELEARGTTQVYGPYSLVFE